MADKKPPVPPRWCRTCIAAAIGLVALTSLLMLTWQLVTGVSAAPSWMNRAVSALFLACMILVISGVAGMWRAARRP